MRPTIRSLQLVSLGALVSVACASSSTTHTQATQPGASRTEAFREDPTPAKTMQASPLLDPIYFDTDRALLRPEARDRLESRARAILAHPEWGVVTIEGHCDERGSDEYNLALGERRATTVQRYLMDLGVPSSRMRTVTFGESRPAVPGHAESAWRYNRRSELQSEAVRSARR